MSTIVNKTTIVAGTGTGPSYSDYRLVGDIAMFREVAPTAKPGFVTFSRTEPKPTKDYSGVGRGQVKLTRGYVDAVGVERPAVITISDSLPETMTQAQKDAFVNEALLLFIDPTSQACLNKRTVPQS